MEKDNKEQLFIGAHPLDLNENMDVILSIAQKIEDIIPKENSENNNRFEKEHPNIIALLGSRGSGKTSILYTLGNLIFDINSSNIKELEKYKDTLSNTYVLKKLIDPSMINGENNILKIILSLLFNDYINRKNVEESWDYQATIEQFIKVNQIMNYITRGKKEFESLENLLDSQNVFKLRDEIKELITRFLSTLSIKKKYLLILIDDIDLNATACYEMLEQLRKYMDLDNVVIILSGNLGDFNSTLLNEYCKQLHYFVSSQDDRFRAEGLQRIQKLAYNYLIKIVPTPYRIDINLIAESAKKKYRKQILSCLSRYGVNLSVLGNNVNLLGILFGKSLREVVQYHYWLMSISEQVEQEKENRIKTFLEIVSEHIPIDNEVRILISNQELEEFDGKDFLLPFVKGKSLFVDVSDNYILNWFYIMIHLYSNLNKDNILIFLNALSIKECALLTKRSLIEEYCRSFPQYIITREISNFENMNELYLWDLINAREIQQNLIIISYFLSIVYLARKERRIRPYRKQFFTILKYIGSTKLEKAFKELYTFMEKEFNMRIDIEFAERNSYVMKINKLRLYENLIRNGSDFFSFDRVKRDIARIVEMNPVEVGKELASVTPTADLDFIKNYQEEDFNSVTRGKYIDSLTLMIERFIRKYKDERQ